MKRILKTATLILIPCLAITLVLMLYTVIFYSV